jgi:hypothetical protein
MTVPIIHVMHENGEACTCGCPNAARLKPSGQVAEDVALVRKAVDDSRMLGYTAEDDEAVDALSRLAAKAQAHDAAVASNAALLEALDGATQLLAEYDAAGAESIDNHVDVTDKNAHPGAAMLEEHRKALVWARNEAREDAAALADGEAARWDAHDQPGSKERAAVLRGIATLIRSKRETEQ